MRLLVTTFEAILVVHLNDLLNVTAIEKVETGAGIYFGASRDRDLTYVVSRNVDIDGNVPMPDRVTNSILECNIGASLFVWRGWSHRDLHDLHQIRVGGPYLFVLTSLTPCLRIFSLEERSLIAEVDIGKFVPADLHRAASTESPVDIYHFNSLTFSPGRLHVLAHNWAYGSFALSFEIDMQRIAAGELTLAEVHRDLGHEGHDVFFDSGTLHTLDSRGNRRAPARRAIARRRAADRRISARAGGFGPVAVRHLGQRERRSRRTCRHRSARARASIGRPQVRSHQSLGKYGDPCDITLVDDRDFTDETVMARRARPRPTSFQLAHARAHAARDQQHDDRGTSARRRS